MATPRSRAKEGKITEAFLRSLKRPGIHRDGVIPGFLVRAGKRARTFELRIERPPKANITLGDWADPDVPLSVDQAREMARTLIRRHKLGEPLHGPDVKKLTLAEAAPLYIDDLRAREKSDRSIEFVESALNRMELTVCAKTLRELSDDPDIMKDEWERIKIANGPVAGMASAKVVRTLYRFIKKDRDQTLPERMPTARIPIKHIEGAKPVLSPDEMPAWNGLRLALNNDVRKEMWLLGLLTGLRRDNLSGLAWEMLDRELGIMKMMQKGNKRLMLVLSQPILDCLDRAREAGDRLYPLNAKTWCFPNSGRRVGHCTGNEDDIVMSLRSEGGLNTTIGAHALRRTYSSNCGLPEEIVDRLLGHTRRANPVMGAYNIDSARIEEYRHLQERASARLVAALGPLGVAGLG